MGKAVTTNGVTSRFNRGYVADFRGYIANFRGYVATENLNPLLSMEKSFSFLLSTYSYLFLCVVAVDNQLRRKGEESFHPKTFCTSQIQTG